MSARPVGPDFAPGKARIVRKSAGEVSFQDPSPLRLSETIQSVRMIRIRVYLRILTISSACSTTRSSGMSDVSTKIASSAFTSGVAERSRSRRSRSSSSERICSTVTSLPRPRSSSHRLRARTSSEARETVLPERSEILSCRCRGHPSPRPRLEPSRGASRRPPHGPRGWLQLPMKRGSHPGDGSLLSHHGHRERPGGGPGRLRV